jgi:hypothetical protein
VDASIQIEALLDAAIDKIAKICYTATHFNSRRKSPADVARRVRFWHGGAVRCGNVAVPLSLFRAVVADIPLLWPLISRCYAADIPLFSRCSGIGKMGEKPINYRMLEILIGKRNFLAEQQKAFPVGRAGRSSEGRSASNCDTANGRIAWSPAAACVIVPASLWREGP